MSLILVSGDLPAEAVARLCELVAAAGGYINTETHKTTQQRALDVLRAAEGPLTSAEVAQRMSTSRNAARSILSRLVDRGLAARDLQKTGRGYQSQFTVTASGRATAA